MTENDKQAVGETEKISKELAEKDFKRFVEAMDLDVDPEGMSDEDKLGLDNNKRIFCRAVRAGFLIVEEDGVPVYTPQISDPPHPIKFPEPDGAVVKAIDLAREGQDVSKAFKMLSALTHTSVPRFSNMKYRDLRVCTAIMTLFMG